jgi:DNA-directed RNA polymerase specialized sigma24 family protein
MKRICFDRLPAFDQQVGDLIYVVLGMESYWSRLRQFGRYDDALQDIYEYVALTRRDDFIGRPTGYLVNVMKNRLSDFLHQNNCLGFCSRGGSVPTKDLSTVTVFVSGIEIDDSDDSSGYAEFDHYVCSQQPSSDELLTQIANDEALDHFLGQPDCQRLMQAVSATSRAARAHIMGVSEKNVAAEMQQVFEQLRAAVSARLGRYGG